MTTKTVTPLTPRLPPLRPRMLWQNPPCTTEERVDRIESLSRRIAGYVQFMCDGSNANNASADGREKAVGAFYEQMVVTERQLGRIHEDFQLE